MTPFQTPVNPLHPAVGKGALNQQELLIADHRKRLSNPLHRAVDLLKTPATVLVRDAFADVSLVPAECCLLYTSPSPRDPE